MWNKNHTDLPVTKAVESLLTLLMHAQCQWFYMEFSHHTNNAYLTRNIPYDTNTHALIQYIGLQVILDSSSPCLFFTAIDKTILQCDLLDLFVTFADMKPVSFRKYLVKSLTKLEQLTSTRNVVALHSFSWCSDTNWRLILHYFRKFRIVCPNRPWTYKLEMDRNMDHVH